MWDVIGLDFHFSLFSVNKKILNYLVTFLAFEFLDSEVQWAEVSASL